MSAHLRAMEAELAAVPGTVSVWCGPLGGPPRYARLADETHYAASTMKVAVLAALYRADEAGTLALDTPVAVCNDFASAAHGSPKALAGADSYNPPPAPEHNRHRPRFGCDREYDSDGAVWDRMGQTVPLRWLAHRMIVQSGNLATNLVLSYVGLPAVAEVWRLAGARHSVTGRGIEDYVAREAGITNLVTAADLAALLTAIATGTLASPDACRAMLDVLLAQEHREDLAAGLPAGTRIAHKSGWVHGVRHGAGVVFPDDAPPYALVVCTTTGLATGADRDPTNPDPHPPPHDPACRLLARIAAASWADREHQP